MSALFICVVSPFEQVRLSLSSAILKNYENLLILSDFDLSYYKKQLLQYEQLCIILPIDIITPSITSTAKSHQHSIIPFLDNPKPICKKTFEVFITPRDNSAEIFNKIDASVRKKKINDVSETLSERETEVLKYIAKGNSNKEIAANMHLSPHTVMTHRKNITNKLGIKSISGLTVFAILQNIISMDEAAM